MPDNFSEAFRSKTVLITGGAGFIGSNLARRLVGLGARVNLVDNMREGHGGNLHNIADIAGCVTLNISDVGDQTSLHFFLRNADFIFNLAGQTSHMDSMVDPFADLKVNTEAQISLLESCRKWNAAARVVFASTRQIYGKPRTLPVAEDHLLEPVDVNGINKMAGEWYHVLYNRVYGLRCTSLRLTNTYGPRMRIKDARQTFLGVWIKAVLSGSEFEVWGGDQLRDYNYIEDVIDAFLLTAATDSTIGHIYNLGHSEVLSLRDTAQTLVDVAQRGRFAIREFPTERKSIDIGSFYSDYQKFSRATGWVPRTRLAEGLDHSLRYFSGCLEKYT